MRTLKILLTVLVVVVLAAIGAGRMGWLQGTPPTDLGVKNGRLKPPATTPNSVSSQAALHPDHPMRQKAAIDPLPLKGDGPATLARIATIVETMPGAQVVTREPGYLYVRFTTRLMRFVDDAEFWHDPAAQVVQVRSASRVGHGDGGVNRARVEAVRSALGN